MKKMFTLLMLLTMSMSTVFAQTPDGDKAEERLNRMIERKAKDLKLDDATVTWFVPLYK